MKVTGITFTQGRTVIAKLISIFTHGGPSHVVINVHDEHLGNLILHSTHGGVRVDSPRNWLKRSKHRILAHYKVVRSEELSLSETVDALLGSPYATWELIGNGIARIASWITFGLWRPRNPWRKNVVCSELVYLVLKGKYPYIAKYNQDMVSPKDLMIEFDKHPKDFKKVLGYTKADFLA